MAKSKSTDASIETKLISIETIIEQLESGDLTLEQSLTLFTDGTKLISDCRNILDDTAKKIEKITQNQPETKKSAATPLDLPFDLETDIPF